MQNRYSIQCIKWAHNFVYSQFIKPSKFVWCRAGLNIIPNVIQDMPYTGNVKGQSTSTHREPILY